MNTFLDVLMSYPVAVFATPFSVFFGLMVVDLIFDLSDGSLGDADGFDADSTWSAKVLLPPIMSQVPLPIALTVSTFVATIIAFYAQEYFFSLFSGTVFYLVTAPALIGIFYLSLHISAFVLKPLGPVLSRKNAFAKIEFEGMRAFVRSNVVTEKQGEVVVKQGANEIQLDAYSDSHSDINYGDEVVIVSKSKELNRYLVAKL